MATHIVTLGWDHPSRVLPSILNMGTPTKVYLVCSAKSKTDPREVGHAIAEHIRRRLDDLRIEAEIVRVEAFQAGNVFRQLLDIEDRVPNEIFLNVTGGTKIMVVAAMMYAMTSRRVHTIYYGTAQNYASPLKDHPRLKPEEVGEVPRDSFISFGFGENIVIPKLTDADLFENPKNPGTLLLMNLYASQYGSVGELVGKVSRAAELSQNTVRAQVKELKDVDLLELEPEGRHVRPRLTPSGKELAVLLRAKFGTETAAQEGT